MTPNTQIVRFFAELGVSRRIQTSGPKLAGIKTTANLAEHAFRAAQIGYVLAFLEGADPEKTAAIVLFHDNAEIRIGDQHKVAARYVDVKAAEIQALKDQVSNLPPQLARRIEALNQTYEARDTQEGIVAKDANWLETAVSAKEYLERGYQGMQNWIDNVREALETESAKKLLQEIESQKDFTNSWWQGLKKMTYRKLRKK
jgi:putative hydrolase of HD superfamily